MAQDRLQVSGREQAGEGVCQRLQADRAGGALEQQAEDLLHCHRSSKWCRRHIRRRHWICCRCAGGEQRAQQRFLQGCTVEAGGVDRLLAASGASDALVESRCAARRAHEDRRVDGADVDAQFQGTAGEAERGVGLGKLRLDLPAAMAFQVGVVDEDLLAKGRSCCAHGGGVGFDFSAACCRRPAPCASRALGRWPGTQPARRLSLAAMASSSTSKVRPPGTLITCAAGK